MFKITLNNHWKNVLLELPETGMGFQKVLVTLKNGEIIRGVVLNVTELKTNELVDLNNIIKIELE